ncbi:proline--tRNA ligase [Spiroplasma endosymbiont of Labia minor]|uniref:proline--tRNA ligase n=1 Tax=Spiroplasma endosymbiont of Labia minor TaxID=3066305 RepID=UPI0030CD9B33
MAKQLEKITPRSEDFSKWYTDIVKNADLIDYGPVKGTVIFKPYGFAIWELIQQKLDKEFKKIGISNVYFPLLIPKSLFLKEQEHIEGFAPELATVTKVGDKELEEPFFIRPTSEVLFANYFMKDVKSYRDLPKLYNQWVNVIRWEKTTRPFLRTSEFLWQEGHTLHATADEARQFTLTILRIYEKFAKENLAIPVITGKKSEMEKFSGAKDTYTIEAMMYDGQALQAGTSHYLGNNFSSVYNIQFQNKENKLENPYGTSWGVSTRLIGGIIMTHSDDSGLVLPSDIAPIQIAIVIVKNTDEIISVANNLLNRLQINNFRVNIEDSDKSLGFKMAEVEIKGIPLRMEIGPRDLENGVVTISKRNNSIKIQISLENIVEEAKKMLVEYDQSLYEDALKRRDEKICEVNFLEEYIEIINKNPGFVIAPFCGRIECEQEIKQKTATTSRCMQSNDLKKIYKCFNCQQETSTKYYFAKSY